MAASSSSEPVAFSSSSSSEELAASSGEAAPAAGGRLSAAALSLADVAIAAPGSTKEGFGYIGVWAKDAATCGAIESAGQGDFAVITVSTFRDGPLPAFGHLGPLTDGKVTVSLSGGTRTIAIEQTSADALTIDGKAYVRCTP